VGFVIVPPCVLIYAFSVEDPDAAGVAVTVVVWLAVTVSLVWYLRLPRRPDSN
jgi:hypothetical protein